MFESMPILFLGDMIKALEHEEQPICIRSWINCPITTLIEYKGGDKSLPLSWIDQEYGNLVGDNFIAEFDEWPLQMQFLASASVFGYPSQTVLSEVGKELLLKELRTTLNMKLGVAANGSPTL